MIGTPLPPLSAQQIEAIESCLRDLCRLTGMPFASVGRIASGRGTTRTVIDTINVGVRPEDEHALESVICDEVRRTGRGLFIDDAAAGSHWRTHPAPPLHGFRSYASVPLVLDDGSLYGTLCLLDREPRRLGHAATVEAMEACAMKIASVLSTGTATAH